MARPSLPTLKGKVHRDVDVAIRRLQNHLDQLSATQETIDARLRARGRAATLAEINQALSATGSHPLNLTGLVGGSTTAPTSTGAVTPPTPPVPPTPPPPGAVLKPQEGTGLVREGTTGIFHLASSGATWPWRGTSDFRLFQRYLDGEDITPILANRVATGANICRVFGMYSGGIGTFLPASYPTYFTGLPAFATKLNSAGLFLEFTVFADAQVVMPTSAAQQAHFALVVAALAGNGNVFIELVNEYPKNGVDPTPFTRPTGILSSPGSGLSDQFPFYPPWDYGTFHTPRDGEWPRKSKSGQDIRDGFVGWPGLHRATVNDEMIGAGDSDIAGSRSTNAQDFYEYGAGCQMFCAGGTFHSDQGIQSVVFSGTQGACATAFFSAIALVDPASQTWNYANGNTAQSALVHTDQPDPNGALRTYTKYSGGSAVVIVVRPGATWTAVPQGGWIIDSQHGPKNELVFLHR